MPSRWCPECGRIVSSSSIPNYCPWCSCSLKNEPFLPPYSEWKNVSDVISKARENWEKRQKELQMATPIDLGNGRLQMRLF